MPTIRIYEALEDNDQNKKNDQLDDKSDSAHVEEIASPKQMKKRYCKILIFRYSFYALGFRVQSLTIFM